MAKRIAVGAGDLPGLASLIQGLVYCVLSLVAYRWAIQAPEEIAGEPIAFRCNTNAGNNVVDDRTIGSIS
jgi:hypothetical protein